MSNNLELLNQIISLADFSTIDSILFHYNHIITIFIFTYMMVNFVALLYIDVKRIKNKSLENLFIANTIIALFIAWYGAVFHNPFSIKSRTNLNEQQVTLLKTIDDPNVIQAINYNVARYGANLYSIDRAISETDAVLEDIEKEKVTIKEKQRLINPPKFL